MDKIQKALAKLYFALGEQQAKNQATAEISASVAECSAYLAIRGTGEALGYRYFVMGAASARRQTSKPPRGKKLFPGKRCGNLPPRGKNAKSPQSIKSKKREVLEMENDFDEEDFYD